MSGQSSPNNHSGGSSLTGSHGDRTHFSTQQKEGLSVPQRTGLYQAQTLELRGRKHREADHAHCIVALRFYDSQDAIN